MKNKMKHVKTFEGFFDLFKREYSETNKLVLDIYNKLKKQDIENINIDKSDTGVSDSIVSNKNIVNVKYFVNVDDINFNIAKSENRTFIGEPTDIPLHKMNSTLKNNFWNDEFQEKLIGDGAVKASSDLFYKLEINNEPIICDISLIINLFNLIESILNKKSEFF